MKSNEALEWIKAMKSELMAHADNDPWNLIRRTSGARPIGCRWVLAKKWGEQGQVERYKARLVAKGFKAEIWRRLLRDLFARRQQELDQGHVICNGREGLCYAAAGCGYGVSEQ